MNRIWTFAVGLACGIGVGIAYAAMGREGSQRDPLRSGQPRADAGERPAAQAPRLSTREEVTRVELEALKAQMQSTRGSLEAMTRRIGERDPQTDAKPRAPRPADDSKAYLRRLIARYPTLEPSRERDELLNDITVETQTLVSKSRDLGELDFFRRLLAKPDATFDERHSAAIVAHPLGGAEVPGVLGYYEEHLRTADPLLRKFAAEGLGWIRGAEQEAARARLRALVQDSDAGVRAMAAGTLAALVKERSDADLLARQLERETARPAAEELVDGIKALDPEGFAARMRSAVDRVSPEVRTVIESRTQAK